MPGFNQACNISVNTTTLISFLYSRQNSLNLCWQSTFGRNYLSDAEANIQLHLKSTDKGVHLVSVPHV